MQYGNCIDGAKDQTHHSPLGLQLLTTDICIRQAKHAPLQLHSQVRPPKSSLVQPMEQYRFHMRPYTDNIKRTHSKGGNNI